MVPEHSAEFRALVESYSDPYLGTTLGNAKVVESVELKGDRAHIRVAMGFPIDDYRLEFTQGLQAHILASGGPANVTVVVFNRSVLPPVLVSTSFSATCAPSSAPESSEVPAAIGA